MLVQNSLEVNRNNHRHIIIQARNIVLGTVTRSSMDAACTCLQSNVIAVYNEESRSINGWRQTMYSRSLPLKALYYFVASESCCLLNRVNKLGCKNVHFTVFNFNQ